MSRQNYTKVGVRPARVDLLVPRVLRSVRLSPSYQRVTLGGEDLLRFTPMGSDQWVRLFIPAPGADAALTRVPSRLTPASYVRFLTLARTERPLMRSYTVRAFRADGPEGPELDVDLVLHAGAAAAWASTCRPGDPVAILDEGIGFAPRPDVRRVHLVADETAVPAAAAILATLPADATGTAVLEVPGPDDVLDISAPPSIEIVHLPRSDPHARPGALALATTLATPLPDTDVHAWAAGEATLATTARRHWATQGIPRNQITFCGYWRA